MHATELVNLFRAEPPVVDEVDIPRDDQLTLLSNVASAYERHGLIDDGETSPLWSCCPRAHECWRGAMDSRPAASDQRAGIALPWIGPDYRRGTGIAVLALNLRDAGGLLIEYAITCRTAGAGSQLNCLAAGARLAHGSRIAYGSARSAAAIQDWLAGVEIRDRVDPTELVEVLNAMVRLQTVKCSPHDERRSTPTDAMAINCPELLLADELAILRPQALLVLGTQAWRAVTDMPGYVEIGWAEQLSVGQLQTEADRIAVFSVAHPAAGDLWDRGHAELVKQLRRAPAP